MRIIRSPWPVATLALVIAACFMGYLWQTHFSPQAKRSAATAANYTAYQEAINRHDKAMEKDTSGGRSPEETIALLTAALERQDAAAAASYFALEDNPSSPDYLTRRAVENSLADLAQKNALPQLAKILREMHPAGHKTASNNTIDYISDSPPQHSMTLRYNDKTKVWKVESL